MNYLMPELAGRIFEQPLMMHPAKAAAALMAIGGRIVEGGVVLDGPLPVAHTAFEHGRPSMGRVSDRLGRAYDHEGTLPFDIVDRAAIIPVEGTLVHKGGYVGMSSGRTSYQGLQVQITRAARAFGSGTIKGAVFEIDSFGGEVAGAFETAGLIRQLSAIMPTMAILTDHALSSGYLLASGARQIVMPKHGRAGSIGVIRLHVDQSLALEKNGIKVTVISAGKHKTDGNPFEPLAEETFTKMKADIEAMRITFAEAVAAGRGNRLSMAAALATEAASFDGPEAVQLGLADAVGNAGEALAAFLKEINRA